MGGVGSYPLLSQAPTHVELGCDNLTVSHAYKDCTRSKKCGDSDAIVSDEPTSVGNGGNIVC